MAADFSMVTARLATGAAVTSAADAHEVAAAGVTHILDLAEEDDQQWLARELAVTYLWNPTADDGAVKLPGWWERSLAFAVTAYARLGTVLLCHCAAGVNRGPSVAYSVMRACWGLDSSTALAMIKTARPQAEVAYAGQFDTYWGG